MKMKAFLVFVILVLSFVSVLIIPDNSNSQYVEDGKSKNTAYTKELLLKTGESKVIYFNTNVNSYDFTNEGDGYYYSVSKNDITYHVGHILIDKNLALFDDTWPANNTYHCVLDNLDIKIQKIDSRSGVTIQVQLLNNRHSEFYLSFWIQSHGIQQEIYYKYEINWDYSPGYCILYEIIDVPEDGLFYAQGSLYFDDTLLDPSDYDFYVTGLFEGVSLKSDLSISGFVDDTDDRWLNENFMFLDFIVTKKQTHQKIIIDDTLLCFFYFDTSDGVQFDVKLDGEVVINELSSNKTLTVSENADVILTLKNGTYTSIISTSDNKFDETSFLSTSIVDVSQSVTTKGCGTYYLVLKHPMGGSDLVKITVLSSNVPKNAIHVSCTSLI